MRTFPNFSAAVESMLPPTATGTGNETLEVRLIVNEAYTKLNKAMWECLNFIAKDEPGARPSSSNHTGVGIGLAHAAAHALSGPTASSSTAADPEDKEALNYHILLIENMNHYLEEVDSRSNPVLKEWRGRASDDLASHLAQYTDAVIRRPLGKWLDFIEGTEAVLRSADPGSTSSTDHTSGPVGMGSSISIATRPSHSRSTVKKILSAHDAKEIRKGVETLKKRIEKHFGEGDDMVLARSLVGKVFAECAARYAEAWERMGKLLDRLYNTAAGGSGDGKGEGGGLEIEWRKEEVAVLFKR
jgi:exocyst complex component 1